MEKWEWSTTPVTDLSNIQGGFFSQNVSVQIRTLKDSARSKVSSFVLRLHIEFNQDKLALPDNLL